MIIYEPQTQYVRKEIESVKIIDSPEAYKHGYSFLHKTAQDLTREHLIVCGMNNRNMVVFTQILTVGTDSQTLVAPRDVIKSVLLNNCNTFIIYHNHPSGDPQPSSADARVTMALKEAANIMGLNLYDHVILGEVENDPMGLGYYSFKEAGRI